MTAAVIDALRLGVELPALAARPAHREGSAREALRALGRSAEAAGVGSLWIGDGAPALGAPDPCVLAGALATLAARPVLGVVDHLDGRAPAVLARDVIAVHLLSGCRAALLLCPSGVAGRAGGDRLGRLQEAAAICRAVFSGELPAFSGDHFSLAGAPGRPRFPLASQPLLVAALPDELPLPRPEQGLAGLASAVDAIAVGGGPDRVSVMVSALGGASHRPLVLWRGVVPSGAAGSTGSLLGAGADGLLVRPPEGEPLEGWVEELARTLFPAIDDPASRP